MKIVIDIEQELYEEILSRKYSKTRIEKAVAKGKPLPEHHGDLIDRNDLIKDFRDSKKGFWRKKHFIKGEATMESMAYEINDIKNILNDAPTIIEGSESK